MPRAKSPRTTSTSKQVIPMPEVSSAAPTIRKNGGSAVTTPIDLDAQIRQRAYEIYEERGCTPGNEQEDWVRAEREVLARYNQQQLA